MIFAQTLAGANSVLVAGTSGTQTGFNNGLYGSLIRSPLGLRALGSKISAFYHNAGGGGFVVLAVSGNQLSALVGKSIFVNSTEIAFDDADSASYSAPNTQYSWVTSNPFTNGATHTLKVV